MTVAAFLTFTFNSLFTALWNLGAPIYKLFYILRSPFALSCTEHRLLGHKSYLGSSSGKAFKVDYAELIMGDKGF